MVIKQKFFSFDEVCARHNVSEEALRQALASGELPAFVLLREEMSHLVFGSGEGGVAPSHGEGDLARWSKRHRPTWKNGEPLPGAAFHYCLSGWFRVAPNCLKRAALNDGFGCVSVLPPNEGGGALADGDVFEISVQDRNLYEQDDDSPDGWLGSMFPTVTFRPSVRDLWFGPEVVEPLAPSKGAEESAAMSDGGRMAKPLGTRERNNLLRIVRALCQEAKIDLDNGKGTAQVVAALGLARFHGPGEKTVREILNDVRNLSPDQ